MCFVKLRFYWNLQLQQMYHLIVQRVHQNGKLLNLQHQLALQEVSLEWEISHLRNFIRQQENSLQIIRLVKGLLELYIRESFMMDLLWL